MSLRQIRLSVIPAVLFFVGAVGCNELVATEPGVEPALYGTPQFSHASADTSARGHVDIVEGLDRYSFTARVQGEGAERTVSGQFQLFTNVGTDFETKIHGEITCLAVLPDGTAAMGGVITRSQPALPEGQPLGVIFSVIDNGEGRNSEDGGSFFIFGIPAEITAELCSNIVLPAQPSSRGNVQVSTR